MLKGIDPVINADVIHALMLMGHGDTLVLCDVNHPAQTIARETTYGKLLNISGCGLVQATTAVLRLFPLDTFVEAPVQRMQVVGDPQKHLPLFCEIQKVIDSAENRAVTMEALERFAFYDAAKRAFAVIRTSDPGPYGCFIFRKGVI